jgi:hypothetical protein
VSGRELRADLDKVADNEAYFDAYERIQRSVPVRELLPN